MRNDHSRFAPGTEASTAPTLEDPPTSHVSSVFAPRLRNSSDPSSSLSDHHHQKVSRVKNTVKLWKSQLEHGVHKAQSEGREERDELREKEAQPLRTLSGRTRGLEQRVRAKVGEERKRVSSRYPGTIGSNSGATRNGTAQASLGGASSGGGWTTAFSEGHRHHHERSDHPHEHHHRREEREPKEHHHHHDHSPSPEEHHSHSHERHPHEHEHSRHRRTSEREDSEDSRPPSPRRHRGRERRSADNSEESGEERPRRRERKEESYRNSSDESGEDNGSEDE